MGAALFDLDGVLADSRDTITTCVNRALVARGHGARAAEELVAFIGPPTRVGFAELTGEPSGGPEVEALVAEYRSHYASELRGTASFPGVPEAVRGLVADGWRLGVATSKTSRFAGPVLEAIGLADAFEVVCGPAPDSGAGKAETVREALARLGGAVALVGDRRFDVEAAHAHGLVAVGVTWGFGPREELEAAGADVLVDRPEDLAAILAGLDAGTCATGA